MVMIFFVQRDTGSQHPDYFFQQVHIVASLLHQAVIPFEFAGVDYFKHILNVCSAFSLPIPTCDYHPAFESSEKSIGSP